MPSIYMFSIFLDCTPSGLRHYIRTYMYENGIYTNVRKLRVANVGVILAEKCAVCKSALVFRCTCAMLLCFVVCLTLLASFFLPSSSLMCMA